MIWIFQLTRGRTNYKWTALVTELRRLVLYLHGKSHSQVGSSGKGVAGCRHAHIQLAAGPPFDSSAGNARGRPRTWGEQFLSWVSRRRQSEWDNKRSCVQLASNLRQKDVVSGFLRAVTYWKI